jgi:hypothetical protein
MYFPFVDFARGWRRNMKYTIQYYKDMRGDVGKAAPSCPFDSIDTMSFNTMLKRE